MLRAADRYAYTGCGSTACCYLFYLGDEQILIHIRKPCRTSACLVRIAGPCPAVPFQLVPVQLCLSSWFLSSWVSFQLAHASCGVRTCESPPKRGLHATMASMHVKETKASPRTAIEYYIFKQCFTCVSQYHTHIGG